MKVIIAGSRTIKDYYKVFDVVCQAMKYFKIKSDDIEEFVCGGAKGVDKLAIDFAINSQITMIIFPAEWDKYGKKAGYIRNTEMANYADALIAIWDGESKGTKMMIDIAKIKGLEVFVYNEKEKI